MTISPPFPFTTSALYPRQRLRTETKPDLEVRVHDRGPGNLTFGLHGEIDDRTAPLLEGVLEAVAQNHLRDGKAGTVTFDLAGVKFVYTRGLTLLQELCQRLTEAGWRVDLVNATPNVAGLLAIARRHHALIPANR